MAVSGSPVFNPLNKSPKEVVTSSRKDFIFLASKNFENPSKKSLTPGNVSINIFPTSIPAYVTSFNTLSNDIKPFIKTLLCIAPREKPSINLSKNPPVIPSCLIILSIEPDNLEIVISNVIRSEEHTSELQSQ